MHSIFKFVVFEIILLFGIHMLCLESDIKNWKYFATQLFRDIYVVTSQFF